MHAFWEIVASHALVVAILAVCVAVLGRMWKNPAALHLLWVLVLVKCVTPPLVTVRVRLPATDRRLAAEEPEAQAAASRPQVEGFREDAFATFNEPNQRVLEKQPTKPDVGVARSVAVWQGISWLGVLAWTWGAGIVVLASGRAYCMHRFLSLLRAAEVPPPAVLSLAEGIGERLGLKRVPQILLVPARLSPLVWSLGGRPHVLLPAALFERLDGKAQEAILAHELAHVRRKDHWVRLLELVVTALFWWHPVVWWACRELRDLEEQCCDGLVLRAVPGGARAYATALVDTLDFLSERSVAVPLVATGAKSAVSMARRIKMLKNPAPVVQLTIGRLLLLLAVAAVPLAVAFGQKPPESTEQTPQAVVEKRAVNRLVKDFPEKTDLSTPESAMAAFSRSVARKDIPAALDLSWVKLDSQSAKDAAKEIEDALDLGLLEDFSQQVLDTEIVEVLTYNDDFAAVIHKSGLLPAGRQYAAQHFGRIKGEWKNLHWGETGENISPSVAAAEENFEKRKGDLWGAFVKARDDIAHGRTPVVKNAGNRPRPSLSAAEKAEIKRWQGETWQMGIDLDMPSLEPQAVQFAIFDEDPVPAFTAQVKRMRTHSRQQLEKADNEARKQQLRAIQMKVSWDLGFKEVTGDKLYLLTNRSGTTTMSSNAPGGKRWIVTKTVRIEGKPACWCIAVELKTGEKIDVTFDKSNTFDLGTAFDDAMREAGPAPPPVREVFPGMSIGFSSSEGAEHFEEVKQLIAQKKYKFLKTFESPPGTTQYVYQFTCADGFRTAMNFSMRLEDVTSWEDYLQKKDAQQPSEPEERPTGHRHRQ